MPSTLRRITSALQRGHSQDHDPPEDAYYILVDEPSMENRQRRRASSDDNNLTTPLYKNFSPFLDHFDSDERDASKHSDDEVPQPIITRRRRAPITKKSVTNGISDEEYQKIMQYQALHQVIDSESNANGETSSGEEEHKISESRRSDPIVRQSLPVNGNDEKYFGKQKIKESQALFQMVPKFYKPNLRIISHDRNFVRVETDEITFRCMMKDLDEICEQHNNFNENTEALVMKETGSLLRRKKSSVDLCLKGENIGRNPSQLWKPVLQGNPGSVVKFKAGEQCRSDATNAFSPKSEFVNQVPMETSESADCPWVEIKLRPEDYVNFISVITRDPKLSQMHYRQRFTLNYIDLKFVYHTSTTSKYSFSRPSKSMGAILNYNFPLNRKIKEDVSFPIIFPGVPLTFAKIAEHIWTLEHIYHKSMKDKLMNNQNSSICSYSAKSGDDLYGNYCMNISPNSHKSSNNSAPSTPVIMRNPSNEFRQATNQRTSRQWSEDATSLSNVATEAVPKMRKRDRSKNMLRNSTRGFQKVTGRILDMTNGASPSTPV